MVELTDPIKEQIAVLINEAEGNLDKVRQLVNELNCTTTPPPPPPPNPNNNLILGVNMGKEYDQAQGNHPIFEYIKNLRVFLLLEDVYNGKFPSASDPHFNPNNLDDFNFSMTGYRFRLRQMKEQGFDVRISMESIFEKDTAGNVIRARSFPNKSFSRAEWGGDEATIKANAKKLAIAIHKMYGEFVSRLEFGNEAWGEPGFDAMKWIIRGMIDGFEEEGSDIKLSLGGYQAYEPNNRWSCTSCAYPTGDFIGRIFEPWMENYIDEITVHPYSFRLNSIDLTEAPLNNPKSEFKYLYDIIKWRDDNFPNLKLSITEIGWNSAQVGEAKQAEYLTQVIDEAKRLNIHAVYIYDAVDSPTDPVFSTCGMFTTSSSQRIPSRAKQFLVSLPVLVS